jgi:hypothetical protein
VSKRSGLYPRVRARGDGEWAVSQAGGVLLVETIRRTGLDAFVVDGTGAVAQATRGP